VGSKQTTSSKGRCDRSLKGARDHAQTLKYDEPGILCWLLGISSATIHGWGR
jgi:hypothetical protein